MPGAISTSSSPAIVGAEQRALGHEQGGAALFGGKGRVVADLLDRSDELAVPAFLHDAQPAVLERGLQSAGGEGAAEHHLPGVLADVDEAADADDLVAEPADVDVALGIDLGKGQEGDVEAAAVVEVELVGRHRPAPA